MKEWERIAEYKTAKLDSRIMDTDRFQNPDGHCLICGRKLKDEGKAFYGYSDGSEICMDMEYFEITNGGGCTDVEIGATCTKKLGLI